jgi:hypothetical protein
MDNLYYTTDEINQLQTDIINKHFEKDSDIKNVNIEGVYPSGSSIVSIIDLIKEFEIIGYEECKIDTVHNRHDAQGNYSMNVVKCKLFLNIYGDIYYGLEPNLWTYDDKNSYKKNLILVAFFHRHWNQIINYQTGEVSHTYLSGNLVKKKHIKKNILPKIILSNIISKTLINNEINKLCPNHESSHINIYDKYSSLIPYIIKSYVTNLDLQSKLDEQSSQIQDLQSKLDEQTKLNETLCKRLFELK